MHVIVPGGGLARDDKTWIACRPGFFLPVRVLQRLYRRLFLHKLAAAHANGRLQFFDALAPLSDPRAFARHLEPVRRLDWIVYAKKPFAGPEQVLRYLARYTHRIAISNRRPGLLPPRQAATAMSPSMIAASPSPGRTIATAPNRRP